MVDFNRMSRSLNRWSGSRTGVLGLAVVVVLMAWPGLFSGFQLDDYEQNLILRGDGEFAEVGQPSWWNLFCFAEGSAKENRARIDRGLLPWWSSERLRFNFLRPVSAATHWLDHQLWTGSPWAMHVHSLLWYLLVVFLCHRLYRRFTAAPWVAALATVMFAVDDIHAITVTWIANRNHLIACVLVLAAFACHVCWRLHGRASFGWTSCVLFLVALLAGEAAVAFGAFVVAWAVAIETDRSWRRRLLGIVPSLMTGFAWLMAYRAWGFGSRGSGGYVDPAGEPLSFLIACLERIPAFLASLSGASSSDLAYTFFDGPGRQILFFHHVLATFLAAVVVVPFLRQDRVTRFWSISLILSLLPLSAAFPFDRVLLLASVSSHGLIARILELLLTRRVDVAATNPGTNAAREHGSGSAIGQGALGMSSTEFATDPGQIRAPLSVIWRRVAYLVVGFWLFVHLPFSICAMPVRSGMFVEYGRRIRAGAQSECLEASKNPGGNVILINPPDTFFLWHFAAIRNHSGQVVPRRTWSLGTGLVGLELRRIDDVTLDVTVIGHLLNHPTARLFRHMREPLYTGWTRELSGITYEVTEASAEGQPVRFRIRCDHSLDASRYLWLRWSDGRFVPCVLPEVGESLSIDPVIQNAWYTSELAFDTLGLGSKNAGRRGPSRPTSGRDGSEQRD
ncbi:MAG TPA: hypothetical protein DCE43_11790 [Planctomycetaceae bacterium]|nr:hypothetical protein [Planctomycetaceae bacterium]|tara:strand:- start:2049 stop:4082 length:2034 start_codon:yes stop_codon:yes gene_type:complete